MEDKNICPKIKLYNGNEIPQMGFGVYQIKGDELTEKCVLEALKVGYRHIDTAHYYENERGVGSAIKKSGIPRKQIWVTSKIWVSEYGSGKTTHAFNNMLKRLDLDYIDLVLLHFPFNDYIGAYKDLEKAYEQGKVKSIGICNFENYKFEELCDKAKIKPVINQIEFHPYFQQNELRTRMGKYNTKTEAWGPLGSSRTPIFEEEIIKKLANKYKKSPAQIILRWDIQKGVITIPSSQNIKRVKENIDIFDFEMTQEEINKIDSLNGKRKRNQIDEKELEQEFLNEPPPSDD